MPLTATELLAGTRSTERTVTGRKAAVRRFIVATDSPEAARTADNVPTFPGVYPDDAVLKLERITTEPNGKGGTTVMAFYSNDQRFGTPRQQPPPTEDLVNKSDWAWGMRDVRVEYPINIRGKMLRPVRDNAGGNMVMEKVDAWTLRKGILIERRPIRSLTVRVRLSSIAQISQFDIIADQCEHLHQIGGRVYQYTPASNCVRRLDELLFEITHVWEYDRGTVLPRIPASTDRVFFDSPNPVDPNTRRTLLRAPYAILDAIPADDPGAADPLAGVFKTVQVFPFAEDFDAWRSLPGVPNLD